ncbi:protein Jumonji isoform X2 [Cloeon dipterum]|uniref:protein Jumonji isoform X2 n=1 Tax=Cloeon dipterum TaxID=197152 RepID=UPI00321F985D
MMVVRSDLNRRRKREGSDATVAASTPNEDIEKRTKVHAQRKFAQGSSLSSPALTPVKDKSKGNGSAPEPLAEMIPAKRPKTTDFLTFLCLRGSSFLPSRLNFFNTPPPVANNDPEPVINGHAMHKSPPAKAEKAVPELPMNRKAKEVVKGTKKASTTSTVQALKKKYQEQRLTSKTRSGVLNKLAQKGTLSRGVLNKKLHRFELSAKDKSLSRTRSGAVVEKKPPPKETVLPPKPAKIVKAKLLAKASPEKALTSQRRSTRSSGIGVELVRPADPVVKKSKVTGRVGLRSGGRVTAKPLPVTKRTKGKAPMKPKPKETEEMEESSSEDEKEVEVKKPKIVEKPKTGKEVPVKKVIDQVAKKRLIMTKTVQQKKARLQTRSSVSNPPEKRMASNSPSPPQRNRRCRKSKERAKIYMELWDMNPDDDDDDDDDDDVSSLYSFPDIRRQSVEKRSHSPPSKKRKVEAEKLSKESAKNETQKQKFVNKIPCKTTMTPKPAKEMKKSEPEKIAQPKKVIEKKKQDVQNPSPVAVRKTRGSVLPETLRFSDSEDEMLDKKIMKKVEGRKRKAEKEDKELVREKSPAPATTRRATKANADKIKAQSMSQLVRFTKKKFLTVRKTTEECIQKLMANTLERLNKQEEEEPDKIDSDVIEEPVIQNFDLSYSKNKEQEKQKSHANRKDLEIEKNELNLGKELVAKKSASVVPPPAKLIPKAGDKFYAKKTASIYPPSPAKLKRLTKSVMEKTAAKEKADKEIRKSTEVKIAPKPAPDTHKMKPEEVKVVASPAPSKTVQSSQSRQISAPNFVMINSTTQDVLLIPSVPAVSSPSKYFVCRKDNAAVGVQYMMVPTGKVVLPVTAPLQQAEVKKPVVKKQEQTPKIDEPKKTKTASTPQSTSSTSGVPSGKKSVPDKGEKKGIFQRAREKVMKSTAKSSNPFSPENESSVYAFDTDPEEETPASPPFRRKKEESSPSSSQKQTSIAVQVNLDETVVEPSFNTLKSSTGTPPSKSTQRVEEKSGTEGPILKEPMQPKLVTSVPGKFSAPLNATGLVRSSQHPAATVGKAAGKPVQSKSALHAGKSDAKAPPAPAPAQKSDSSATASSKTPQSGNPMQAVKKPQQPEPSASTSKSSASIPRSVTPKSGSAKKAPLQRQGSIGSSSKEAKATRLFEPQSTPNKFPAPGGSKGTVFEAPVFYPTEKEFQDPFEYIEKISSQAEQFGICRIVPPSSFKPECKVSDDMRFMAYNQYVHKMVSRWGPNAKETAAIKKLLKKQNVAYTHPPWIGGMEIDLPKFSQTVRSLGGLKGVIEKKRWQKVADAMKIPKSAQDRVSKLDDIYCQFLLAYDTLSPGEKQELLDEVESEWDERQKEENANDDDDENFDDNEECITKGRNMPLSAFYRIARNTMSMWFKTPEPSAAEVEAEYWRITRERTNHVCVHSGSIDSGVWGYGFPTNKNSSCAKHPWNLKVLSNNSGTILRSMGSVMGVTVPTLHVGMLFSTFCWYRDPHGLPWIEYLHTGASKIWYGIPNSHSTSFKNAMRTIVPRYCRDKTIWLPSDSSMVPPEQLISHGVSLCRTVQEPGQFILIFPKAFTSSVSTGYLVSESVYFAQPKWLKTAQEIFKELKDSNEPTMFSLERLLFSVAEDNRCHADVLKLALPLLKAIVEREESLRDTLKNIGLKSSERLPLPDSSKKARSNTDEDNEYECEVCRANLYLSMMTNPQEEAVYCLPHAIANLNKKKHQIKNSKLLYTYDLAELKEIVLTVEDRIESKSSKKSTGK